MEEVAKIIRTGGVVVLSTETVYGLHADPTNKTAVEKSFLIKQRKHDMPLGLVAGNIEIVKKYFSLNEKEEKVADKFWPGPLGLALSPSSDKLTSAIFENTLAEQDDFDKPIIRVTSDSTLAEISREFNLPIISTSVNISGQPVCSDVSCMQEQFKDNKVLPDLIIDAGPLPQNQGSTMIDLGGDELVVIREGTDFEEIQKFLAY